MAQTILCTPSDLRSKAGEIESAVKQHQNMLTQVTNLIAALDQEWSGEAQKSFVAAYTGNKKKLDTFDTMLNSFAALMRTCANDMAIRDKAIASVISTLDVD